MRSSMLLVLALLVAAPLYGQQRAVVEFAPGGPTTNGFASASVDIEYGLLACNGEIWITMGLVRSSYRTSAVYWYEGRDYPAPALSGTPAYTYNHVKFAGDVMQSPTQRVGSFDYDVGSGFGGNCFSAVHFQDVATLASVLGANRTQQDVNALMSRLFIRVRPQQIALTSSEVESRIRSDIAREESAAADRLAAQQRQEREDSIRRAESQRQQQQARAAAAAASQTAPAAASRPTPQEDAQARLAAEEARQRQEAADAQAAYEAEIARQEEERRRQEAEAEAAAEMITTTAQIAAESGGLLTIYHLSASGWEVIEEVSGWAIGIDWDLFYVDFGMASGQYHAEFIETYAQENFGAELTPEFSGYFATSGLGLDMDFESMSLGVYGGYLMLVTPESDVLGSMVIGYSMGFGGFKVRADASLSQEVSGFGIGVAFDLF